MNDLLRKCTALALTLILVPLPCMASLAQAPAQSPPGAAAQLPLHDYLQKPYLEIFDLASGVRFTPAQIEAERQALGRAEGTCRSRFKERSKQFGRQLEQARANLKKQSDSLNDPARHDLHCRIQNLELLRSETDVLSGQAIPNAYDNLAAKLDLLVKWPEQNRLTLTQIADGSYRQRRWADVKDIGFREIASGQGDDIKTGQEAVDELKSKGLLPPAVESKPVQDYVKSVAERVAQHSDLKVPLHVTVLQSKEINAFALPGGFLFVERGLLEAADDEAELAGVLAHEIAHDTARHGHKLMKRASVAGIFYQAAQIAALVLTGGVAGIGMYYALQYGFYGLGMVLNLKLLGISRDYELEADQLGVQYAWNAGYDATGFIRFFDKMATKMGYVNGVSWFRTHPPFFERMIETRREIMFLPRPGEDIVQTSAFLAMKKELAPVVAAAEKEEKEKPSLLLRKEEGCAPPQKLEYKPGQPIEELCSMPMPDADAGGQPASAAEAK